MSDDLKMIKIKVNVQISDLTFTSYLFKHRNYMSTA